MTVIRQKNRELRKDVIRQLYYHKMLTLTELSVLCRKSLPLVTSIVNDLSAEGFVVEHGLAPSTGGRRPVAFLLNSEQKRYIVAVAVDQLAVQIVIYDQFNQAQAPVKMISLKLAEDKDALQQLVRFINQHIASSGIAKESFLGVGIGMPGFMDTEKGINHTFFKTGEDVSLRDHLNKEIGLPVFIDNDSTVIALAEHKFGVGKGQKDVLVVNIGWGIGLGMIIHGQLFRGHSGLAGEFSHIPLSQSNKLCSCGKRGCLEVDASLLVLVERAKEKMAQGTSSSMEHLFRDDTKLPGDHLLDAAKAGDPLAVSLLSEAAFLVGKGIATLIHIINPKQIILSGRGARAGRILMAPVDQAIHEFCIPRLAEDTEIRISALASESELLGAAILVMEHCHYK
ncbi:ROK family protein [Pedobacter sp. JY14-1]|uniref:ROK family protein n=1 Tax=Pedobacter sp. JY14-1 TaxID=3034151 RepID=UPI0023E2AEE3|nr:ROK family protein [Pedobacter sp. JY14-1]